MESSRIPYSLTLKKKIPQPEKIRKQFDLTSLARKAYANSYSILVYEAARLGKRTKARVATVEWFMNIL